MRSSPCCQMRTVCMCHRHSISAFSLASDSNSYSYAEEVPRLDYRSSVFVPFRPLTRTASPTPSEDTVIRTLHDSCRVPASPASSICLICFRVLSRLLFFASSDNALGVTRATATYCCCTFVRPIARFSHAHTSILPALTLPPLRPSPPPPLPRR